MEKYYLRVSVFLYFYIVTSQMFGLYVSFFAKSARNMLKLTMISTSKCSFLNFANEHFYNKTNYSDETNLEFL